MPARVGWAEEPEEESVPGATEEEEEAKVVTYKRSHTAQYGLGVRARYVTVPNFLLEAFLQHATYMQSFTAIGAELVRRRGNFDVVFGLEYDAIAPEPGLYQETSDSLLACGQGDESQCPDFVTGEDLALLGVDASFLWHLEVHPVVQLRYGAGIGLGVVLGEVVQHDRQCGPGTSTGDLDDPKACQDLMRSKKADIPPVVPIVNLLVGARFKLHDQISLNVEAGFRDMFFFGGGLNYLF
jgi:hypothetical protein